MRISYALEEITMPGTALTTPWRVNDNGIVVGWTQNSQSPGWLVHGFQWQKVTGMIDIDPGNGSFGQAKGVNNSGQVAAWAESESRDRLLATHAETVYVYRQGNFSYLEQAQQMARCEAINEAGTVAGLWGSSPVVWRNAQRKILPPLVNGTHSYNWSTQTINGNEDVAGYAFIAQPDNLAVHAVLYRFNGSVTDLGTLGGLSSIAHSLNDQQMVVGWAHNSDTPPPGMPGISRACLWVNDQPRDLGTLGGDVSHAYDINANGDIVGGTSDSGGRSVAFLHKNGTMVALNDLIDPALGWWLTDSSCISNHGLIGGVGINGGVRKAFLLTPL